MLISAGVWLLVRALLKSFSVLKSLHFRFLGCCQFSGSQLFTEIRLGDPIYTAQGWHRLGKAQHRPLFEKESTKASCFKSLFLYRGPRRGGDMRLAPAPLPAAAVSA